MKPNDNAAQKISPFLLIIVMITLALALVLIFTGLSEFISNNGSTNQSSNGSIYLTLGFAILAISTYMLFLTKRRPAKIGQEILPLNTTLKCKNCGFTNVREFQRGDYVFKELDDRCQKCSDKMLITSIYREVKEKEKEIGPF